MTQNKYLLELLYENSRTFEVIIKGPDKYQALKDYKENIVIGKYNSNIKGNYPVVYSIKKL